MKMSKVQLKEKQFFRGAKMRIFPSEEIRKILIKFNDLYRYVYNWGIYKEQEAYKEYVRNGRTKATYIGFMKLAKMFICAVMTMQR